MSSSLRDVPSMASTHARSIKAPAWFGVTMFAVASLGFAELAEISARHRCLVSHVFTAENDEFLEA
jgi:hypothetical protein